MSAIWREIPVVYLEQEGEAAGCPQKTGQRSSSTGLETKAS